MSSITKNPPSRLSADYRFTSIQGLRGVAACLVAAMHCLSSKDGLLNPISTLQHQLTMAICAVGGAGVDIFFVISGFIIITLARRRVGEVSRLHETLRFLLHRFSRVYPLYWVTVAVILAATSWFTRNDPNYHSTIKVSELLLTTTHLTVQPPAWTLAFELWFYLGTAVMMLLPPRMFSKAVLVWAIVQAVVLCTYGSIASEPISGIFTRPQVMEFFLGCAVSYAYAYKVLSPQNATLLLLISFCIFVAGCGICYYRLPNGSLTEGERFAYWGISAAIILWSFISLEANGRIAAPIFLQRLGDISYSIYLWHFPVMAIAFSFGLETSISSHKLLQAFLEFFVTLLIASVSYRVIERPTIRIVHQLTTPRRSHSYNPS